MYRIFITLSAIYFAGCQSPEVVDRATAYVAPDTIKPIGSISNEQKFFNSIYKKYPDTYFELGSSIGFHESFNAKTNKLIWKYSFISVDTLAKAEKQYLKEINDPVIQQYIPDLHLYSGKHSCHYELGLDGIDFIGFVFKNHAGFLFDTTATGFNNSFLGAIENINIEGKKNKEKFCTAFLCAVNPDMNDPGSEFPKGRSYLQWTNNKLKVTVKYKTSVSDNLYSMIATFDGDKLLDLTLTGSVF